MSESEIELRIERMFDRLDAHFMSGAMSQDEYDSAVESINRMANSMYELQHLDFIFTPGYNESTLRERS